MKEYYSYERLMNKVQSNIQIEFICRDNAERIINKIRVMKSLNNYNYNSNNSVYIVDDTTAYIMPQITKYECPWLFKIEVRDGFLPWSMGAGYIVFKRRSKSVVETSIGISALNIRDVNCEEFVRVYLEYKDDKIGFRGESHMAIYLHSTDDIKNVIMEEEFKKNMIFGMI